jgi:hypothetical protein
MFSWELRLAYLGGSISALRARARDASYKQFVQALPLTIVQSCSEDAGRTVWQYASISLRLAKSLRCCCWSQSVLAATGVKSLDAVARGISKQKAMASVWHEGFTCRAERMYLQLTLRGDRLLPEHASCSAACRTCELPRLPRVPYAGLVRLLVRDTDTCGCMLTPRSLLYVYPVEQACEPEIGCACLFLVQSSKAREALRRHVALFSRLLRSHTANRRDWFRPQVGRAFLRQVVCHQPA